MLPLPLLLPLLLLLERPLTSLLRLGGGAGSEKSGGFEGEEEERVEVPKDSFPLLFGATGPLTPSSHTKNWAPTSLYLLTRAPRAATPTLRGTRAAREAARAAVEAKRRAPEAAASAAASAALPRR